MPAIIRASAFALAIMLAAQFASCRKEQPPAQASGASAPAPSPDWSGAGASPWSNARNGDTVTYRTSSGGLTITTELKVIGADAQSVTFSQTITAEGTPPETAEKTSPRSADPFRVAQFRAGGTRLAPQTLTIGGKKLLCDVFEMVSADGDTKRLTRYFLCPQVPGWLVRIDQGAPGELATTSELTAFTVGSAATSPNP